MQSLNNFSADEKFDGTFPTNVVVTDAGSCTYIPPGLIQTEMLIFFCKKTVDRDSVKMDIIWTFFNPTIRGFKNGHWGGAFKAQPYKIRF